MPDYIVRFGGNNIKDPSVIDSFQQILKSSSQKHLIVVSAIAEIQEALQKGLAFIKSGSIKHQEVIAKLTGFIDALSLSKTKASDTLNDELSTLETLLKGIEFTGDYSLALQDIIISFSEKITAIILINILESEGITAQLVLPEEIGLKVTSEHGNASVLLQESEETIGAYTFPQISIVPGSYGLNEQNKITRLGNRSADYTAASLTAILNSDHLELWQIGKAFKTADNEIVPNAEFIESLTYSEASELSYFNQSSVHPRIVEPLIEKHIPIRIFDLKNGEKSLRTTINSKSIVAANIVKSVAHTDEIAILSLNGPGVGFKPGILSLVTTAFSKHQINIRSVITAQTSINILIDKKSIASAKKFIKELSLPSVNEIVINEKVSLIAIIGHGMQDNLGISAQLFTAVAKNKINVRLSGSGASDLVSYLVMDENDKNKAIEEIHKIFFNN